MYEVINLMQFDKKLQKYRSYNPYFRGQSAKYKEVIPSVSRGSFKSHEKEIIYDTLRDMPNEFIDLQSPFDKLSRMQHYGIPTRLIDVTENAYVALYFAVEDIEAKYDAHVHLYIGKTVTSDSKAVRLLTLLGFISDHSTFQNIQEIYQKTYSETITESEVNELIQNPVIIQYSSETSKNNQRMNAQRGSFILPTNVTKNRNVVDKIKEIDFKEYRTIKIPYEYKKAVKLELDKAAINRHTIYPELPQYADGIRDRYNPKPARDVLKKEGLYKVYEKEHTVHGKSVRLNLTVELLQRLSIKDVERINEKLINKYKTSFNTIYIYFALNVEDILQFNWLLQGQWIDPKIPEIFKPYPIGEEKSKGRYIKRCSGYVTRSEFNEKYIFKSKKHILLTLLVLKKSLNFNIDTFVSLESFDDLNEFIEVYKEEISTFLISVGDIGQSKDIGFSQFFEKFYESITLLDNFRYLFERDLSKRNSKYIIDMFKEAKEKVMYSKRELIQWEEKLNIKDEDIKDFELETRFYTEPKQIIGVSESAINVYIKEKVVVNDEHLVIIEGSTNLYDGAELIVSIQSNDRKYKASDKTIVKSNKFKAGPFSKQGNSLSKGLYDIHISLSIPVIQPELFRESAGIEYENLTGDLIIRKGSRSTLSYKSDFTIDY